MRILVAAEEAAGIQALRAISQTDHEIVAVLTNTPNSSKKDLGATVPAVARHLGYSLWPANLVRQSGFAETLRCESIDVLLNVHSMYVIRPEVIDATRVGAFNLHPGPLPRYAGMNSPSWAIHNGEVQHGVTLHWMEEGIDTGPIAFQKTFDLTPEDTGLSVSRRCVRLGIELIKQLLATPPPNIPRKNQNLNERQYFGPETPLATDIDWTLSASRIERFIRACNFYPLISPWGVPTLRHADVQLGMVDVALTNRTCDAPAGTVSVEADRMLVATADDWLEIKRCLVDGRLVAPSDLPR